MGREFQTVVCHPVRIGNSMYVSGPCKLQITKRGMFC